MRLVLTRKLALLWNRDVMPPAIIPDQYLDHVRDGAMLPMGGGAQRLLELWLDPKGEGGGLGTGHGAVYRWLAVDVLQGTATAATVQVFVVPRHREDVVTTTPHELFQAGTTSGLVTAVWLPFGGMDRQYRIGLFREIPMR